MQEAWRMRFRRVGAGQSDSPYVEGLDPEERASRRGLDVGSADVSVALVCGETCNQVPQEQGDDLQEKSKAISQWHCSIADLHKHICIS